MAIPSQTLSVPFGAGINTKTDERLVSPPHLLDLQNGVFVEGPGIAKRNGSVVLGRNVAEGGSITAGVAMVTRKDELCLLDAGHLYSYEDGPDEWTKRGRCTGLKVGLATESDKAENQKTADSVTHGGIRITAWIDSSDNAVHYSVVKASTGAVIRYDQAISGATKPKLCGAAGKIFLFYHFAGAAALRMKLFSVGDPYAAPVQAELVTNAHADGLYDVDQAHDGGAVLVVYKRDIATVVTVAAFYVLPRQIFGGGGYVAANLGQDGYAPLTQLFANVPTGLAVSSGASQFHCAFSEAGPNVRFGTFTVTMTAQATAGVFVPGATVKALALQVDRDDNKYAHLWYEEDAAATYNHRVGYRKMDATGVTVTVGSAVITRHCGLAAGAFWAAGRAHVITVYESILQTSYFVLSSDAVHEARLLSGEGGGLITNAHLPNVQEQDDAPDVLSVALIFRKRLSLGKNAVPDAGNKDRIHTDYGVKVVTLDFAASDRLRAVEAGESLYLTGGLLWQYDGVQVVEQGFLLFPEPDQISVVQATGGSLTLLGTYQYRFYYEWTNAAGERQRSTAIVKSVTMTSSNTKLTFTIPTLAQTMKQGTVSDVSIVAYRTEANADTTQGEPLFRVTSPDPASAGNNAYRANDPTVDTVQVVDVLADTDLIDNELDYQNTGEVDNVAPASASIIAQGKRRVFLAGFEDGNKIAYSKYRQGGGQLEFHDGFAFTVPEEGGPVTAMAVLDQVLLVFKRDRVFAVAGDGPSNLQSGAWGEPQLIPTDVGCTNQRVMAVTPEGVFFLSVRGFEFMDRSFVVTDVGAPVEAYNGQDYETATVVTDVSQIRCLTNTGRTLVYDYSLAAVEISGMGGDAPPGQFSRFTGHPRGQWTTFVGFNGVDAATWRGGYVRLKSDGRVFKEVAGLYTDGGSAYRLVVRTPWLRLEGPQGYFRVRSVSVLLDWFSAHQLRTRFRYDYAAPYDEAVYSAAGVAGTSVYGAGGYGAGAYGGTTSGVPYQLHMDAPRQKVQAVSLEFDDIPGSPPGQSFQISNITLEVARKEGPARLQSGQKAAAQGAST